MGGVQRGADYVLCNVASCRTIVPNHLRGKSPLFTQEGYYSSLWQREVRRDFTIQSLHYFETVNHYPECLKESTE